MQKRSSGGAFRSFGQSQTGNNEAARERKNCPFTSLANYIYGGTKE
jgi:hypothetical protein